MVDLCLRNDVEGTGRRIPKTGGWDSRNPRQTYFCALREGCQSTSGTVEGEDVRWEHLIPVGMVTSLPPVFLDLLLFRIVLAETCSQRTRT